MTFKVVCQVPYNVYDKLEPRRASFETFTTRFQRD